LPPHPDWLWDDPASCLVDTRALSLGVKQLGHDADHALPSGAKVKNAWSYTCIML